MVKLASARESRIYGPRQSRTRSEYFNAGLYLFATILLLGGFVAQFSSEPKSGLVLILLALGMIIIVNLHDFLAHLAGIEYRWDFVRFDPQLAYVEFGVPVILGVGTVLSFLGILFLFLEAERGYVNLRLEHHTLNLLFAGALLWVIGCTFNACQVYEQADAHVQLMQQSVYIPFLLGSFLLLVGASLNSRAQAGHTHHGWHLLGEMFIWFGILGSILLFIGGLANVAKVYKMQQAHYHALRLERLRGGAHSLLIQTREGGYGSREPLLASSEETERTSTTGKATSDQGVRFNGGYNSHEPLLASSEETGRTSTTTGKATSDEGVVGFNARKPAEEEVVEEEEEEGEGAKFHVGPTPYKDSLLSNNP